MKKKIALAFAGVLLIMVASFAPITTATWHGLPDVQSDTYIITMGESQSQVMIHTVPQPISLSPIPGPYLTRGPEITPGVQWQDINFSMPLDPDGPGPLPACIVFLTVPWQSIQSLNHVYFSCILGYTRVKLVPVPGSDGMGWLYTVPGIADVDIYVNNTFINNPAPPPPQNPIAIWKSPSPTPGAFAAVPTQTWYPWPDPGADTLPGFCPAGPGTQDDGFGDGVPDPAGSSVLFIPMNLSVEAWNGTNWLFKFCGPFNLPMTTGTANDTVVTGPYPLELDGYSMEYTGAPWEDIATTGMWGANENKKYVTYAYAWSFIQKQVLPEPTVTKLDLIYGGWEKKVKEEHVIPDITCDNVVDIVDIVRAALAFGSRDEGSAAYPGYDPTGKGASSHKWPGPYPGWMPSPWLVEAEPNIEGVPFDAAADVVPDGIIDICDLVKIALDYGKVI